MADTDPKLQRFINNYVEANASKSQLSKLTMYLRAILDLAVDRRLIDCNPARRLKPKSRKRPSSLFHTLAECDRLLAQVSGRDHLAIRLVVQLALRPEEDFALRRNDVRESELVIDEALVEGETKEPKTLASAAVMYVPPDLALELKHYLEGIDEDPQGWLFPSSRKVGNEDEVAYKSMKIWSHPPGSNRRPADYESGEVALSPVRTIARDCSKCLSSKG